MFIKKKFKYFTRPKQISPDLFGESGDFRIAWYTGNLPIIAADQLFGRAVLSSKLKWKFIIFGVFFVYSRATDKARKSVITHWKSVKKHR